MRVIEEFSFDEEPGKTQVKSNITESVEKPNISIVTPFTMQSRISYRHIIVWSIRVWRRLNG